MRKPRIVIVADNKLDVARQLIGIAGSVGAAHGLITKAAKRIPKKPDPDTLRLLRAAAIQKHNRCSPRSALLQAIRVEDKNDRAVANGLRRLQDKLKGRTLADFARRQPFFFKYTLDWDEQLKRKINSFALMVRDF